MATITAGGAAQDALPFSDLRLGWDLQNLSAGSLWYRNDGTVATIGEPSFELPPGAFYETPQGYRGTNRVSIIGATTGQAFAVRER